MCACECRHVCVSSYPSSLYARDGLTTAVVYARQWYSAVSSCARCLQLNLQDTRALHTAKHRMRCCGSGDSAAGHC